MENSSYSSLKASLTSVPARALNSSCRQILSNNLDCTRSIPSGKGFARDYRGLADLMNFQYQEIKQFEKFENRTIKILEAWEIRPDSTLDKLVNYLDEIDRQDIIEDLTPFLKKYAEAYAEYRVSVTESEPVAEIRECATYDAYICYADEDVQVAAEFAHVLESPRLGLKLFIRGRDLAFSESEADIDLIKNRCRRVVTLLTPNFINSPALEFLNRFAEGLDSEQDENKILIPVIMISCEIPPILHKLYYIDLTKEYIRKHMWNRLIVSLLPEDRIKNKSSSPGGSPLSSKNVVPNFSNSASVEHESTPVITFPETGKHEVDSANNFNTKLAITELSDTTSDSADKDSSTCSAAKATVSSPFKKESSSFIHQFLSRLKKNKNSTSAPLSSSGVYRKSSSHEKILENTDNTS